MGLSTAGWQQHQEGTLGECVQEVRLCHVVPWAEEGRQRLRTTWLRDVEVVRTSPVGGMVQTRGEEKLKDLGGWWIGRHSEECCSTFSVTGVVYPEKEGSKGGRQNEAACPSGR